MIATMIAALMIGRDIRWAARKARPDRRAGAGGRGRRPRGPCPSTARRRRRLLRRVDRVDAIDHSSRDRVLAHLGRVGVTHDWDAIVCADGDGTQGKPRPTLYPEALDVLGVDGREAIAFEDSPNGVRAAKAAGLFCVAVPNPITATLALDEADLIVESLEDVSLADLVDER